ncbi:MAG: long-chain fatty acid--CoA ligase, partial [Deltaproteobacteria bacterium]|nr:long-chain fatty acid--CoA ligase [Deltaproteobacteria bacterium]
QLGVGRGDTVAFISNNSVEWAVACYATYGLGARFVPMYEAELLRIWKYILADSGTKVLFASQPEILEQVAGFPDEIEGLEKVILIPGDGPDTMNALEALGAENPVPSVRPDPEEIAGLVYTSGTTGNPKGVLLTHHNLSTNVSALLHAVGDAMGKDDVTLSFLPWAHSFGQVAELHMLVSLGASTGFAERPETIISDILLVHPTILFAVPRIFNKVHGGIHKKMDDTGGFAKWLFYRTRSASQAKRDGRAGLLDQLFLAVGERVVYSKIRDKLGGRLRMSVSSSAALNPNIGDFFDDIGINIYEAWGMTELSPGHTANTPKAKRRGSVGRPLLGCRVEIDRSQTGADSKDGEVIAYGPNVMQGYQNLPEATAEVLRPDGGLHTGDLGWVDEDGFLFISGRIKEQYKLENGKYVFPVGIEEAIKLSPYVENAMLHGANKPFNAVLIVPDFATLDPWAKDKGLPEDHEALVATPEVSTLLESEVQRTCTEFARYEIPKKLVLVSEPFSPANGILTPTLKLKRRKAIERYGEQLDALYGDKG